MRIERLILDQVGCFDHLDISFPEGRDPDKADIHLLVGANGTGKSTILMAMAQFFCLEPTGIEKRFRAQQSHALLNVHGDQWHAVAAGNRLSPPDIPGNPPRPLMLRNPKHRQVGLFGPQPSEPLTFFEQQTIGVPAWPLDEYREISRRFEPLYSQYAGFRFSHAAFAYGGFRSLEVAILDGVVEPNQSPLSYACVMQKPHSGPDTQSLTQWIANTSAKAAFANERNDAVGRGRYREAIARVERVISEITRSRFRFVLVYDPIMVKATLDGQELGIDVLPDGLKSLISWVGDLLMRLERVPWVDDVPVLDRSISLFLDEIEVHLHPAWQRRILPVVQNLFPNAQVFVSTHSPFVIASADDAWIYPLYLDEKGKGHVGEILPSMLGNSYATVLRDVLGIEEEFAPQVQEPLKEFYRLRDDALKGDADAFARLKAKERELAAFGEEVLAVVRPEMRQVERRLSRQVAEPD